MREMPQGSELLISSQQIEQRIGKMAQQISVDFENKSPVVLCVMNGGLVFCGQLLTGLNFPLQLDYVHLSRYGDETHGGELRWIQKPSLELQDCDVLIVDDIFDEGVTLAHLHDYCAEQGAARISIAALLNKHQKQKYREDLVIDYCGFEVANKYVFGFGMDYRGYWRNLPAIYVLPE